jgi:hypothetical protein
MEPSWLGVGGEGAVAAEGEGRCQRRRGQERGDGMREERKGTEGVTGFRSPDLSPDLTNPHKIFGSERYRRDVLY